VVAFLARQDWRASALASALASETIRCAC